VTISLPDEIYRQARIKAAQRDTSLSALVREFLTNLGQNGSDFERRKRLQEEVLSALKRFRARDRLSRDEVHDRNAVR
jgi:plasmid stability protein